MKLVIQPTLLLKTPNSFKTFRTVAEFHFLRSTYTPPIPAETLIQTATTILGNKATNMLIHAVTTTYAPHMINPFLDSTVIIEYRFTK